MTGRLGTAILSTAGLFGTDDGIRFLRYYSSAVEYQTKGLNFA